MGWVQAHVLEALSMVRVHYVAPSTMCGARMIALFGKFVVRAEPHSRLLSVQYANVVFPRTHLASRFICLLAP